MARRGENIYKRKDGRWEGRYKSGFYSNGKTKYASVYGKSYTEVKTLLAGKKDELIKAITPCCLTVKELFDLWLNDRCACSKESTVANYRMKIEKHILPLLGGVRYKDLTTIILNGFVSQKMSEGLSAKYVYDIGVFLKSICKYADRHYNCGNKAEYMEMPKKDKSPEKALLSHTEREKLIRFLMTNCSLKYVGILLSAATGMRIGEVCGLKWSDVDLEKRIITVKRTVQRISDKSGDTATRIIVTSPKSKSSVREIPIPDAIFAILQKLVGKSDDYILSDFNEPLEPRALQYRFKALLKRLNITCVTFHSLRHSFATTCIEIGIDIKTLSELLGHSSVEITLNRYVHSSLKRKTECMKMFSASFAA